MGTGEQRRVLVAALNPSGSGSRETSDAVEVDHFDHISAVRSELSRVPLRLRVTDLYGITCSVRVAVVGGWAW